VRATDWEFRQRFFVFGMIFGVAFFASTIDHVNAGAALAAALAGGDSQATMAYAHAVFAAGAALVVIAGAIRTWGVAYLSSAVVHDAALHTDGLVADGPYRRVRNPLYFANQLLALGAAPMASRLGAAILIVGITLFDLRLIFREEAELERAQGESYLAYRRAVPRLIPSLVPRVPARGTAPRWGQAIAGEAFFWLIALGVVVFAVTLDVRPAAVVVAAAFLVYFAVSFALKRRRDASKT
jgi:protein-S-isoprenylcysteine O-methyltransferase Ste14